MRRPDPALLVVLAGICAALHIGKLPPALPLLRDALGITLVQAGFLLSLVQLAGMTLGLVAGLAADAMGLKRTMVAGLLLLSAASACGAWVHDTPGLLALRAIEGVGFLFAVMPAPGLIRQLVSGARVNAMLGLWGAYMPLGTAVALLLGPFGMALLGWKAWWCVLAAVSALAACGVAVALPGPAPHEARVRQPGSSGRLARTLSARGPWLVALTFAMYSGQWLAVVGFLPSIYAQVGWASAWASAATALAALVNIGGNIASGRLLQRGVAPQRLLYLGFAVMGLAATLAFANPWSSSPGGAAPLIRYGAVLLFSLIGGVIPGTLFSLAVRLAPGEDAVSTTVGWMQQWSSLGQFLGPPLVAWIASAVGGWQMTWLATGLCSAAGMVLAAQLGGLLRR